MIASSFFIAGKLACAHPFANQKRIAARALLTTRMGRSKHRFCVNNFGPSRTGVYSACPSIATKRKRKRRVIPNREDGEGSHDRSGRLSMVACV